MLVDYLHWILDFAIITNINTVCGEVKVAIDGTGPRPRRDVGFDLLLGDFDVFWETSYFEHWVFLATWGDDVRVRLVLYPFDSRSARTNNQTDDFVGHSHFDGDSSMFGSEGTVRGYHRANPGPLSAYNSEVLRCLADLSSCDSDVFRSP